uniref:Diacylglycerol kinase n=1 Tax=Haemonchus placei TaxID=6290 RepID=A0A0N4WK15_HAEPC
LCWLLNPRQVFDITSLKGPKFGLEIYRKLVTQLRILVCGGDGTVGWVLQTLDSLNWPAYPPMAIMPLGTGNDLSRCMGWGGTFSDEPLSQLLQAIFHETTVTHLDRWRIHVSPNETCAMDTSDELSDAVQSSLPLTVMNNYFSIGADAHVALQFHHSRSANPQMLNSRLKNRIAYGGLGTIDLFKRTWKDLSEYIYLECDGIDITPRIKELKLHCILFHNITYYAGGTTPWGSEVTADSVKPSCCDGRIEVLGFTTATLAALQMGGKGERLAQCSQVSVTTYKAIPMQLGLLNRIRNLGVRSCFQVPMLKREKKIACTPNLIRRNTKADKKDSQVQSTSLIVHLPVIVVGRHDYDTYKDVIDRLKETAFEIGVINLESESDLDVARALIQKLLDDHPCLPYEPSKEWRFLDYVTNAEEGTFRVSRGQERVQSVSDICNPDECLLILDDAFPSITSRSTAIGNELVDGAQPPRTLMQRRISETLRIVLSSEAQETHL